MRLGWLSDIHLNFLDQPAIRRFLGELAANDADLWLLGGDIADADSVVECLQLLDRSLRGSICFVLGNHDFYGGSISGVQSRVRQLLEQSQHLVWLTDALPQVHDGRVTIVGDDGWADAGFGNATGTPVLLNDFILIEELIGLGRGELIQVLRELGEAAAARLAPKLEQAASNCSQVVVLTHVPPFWQAAWHQGQPSNENWLPWFACRAVGEAILDCARAHPGTGFLVLCGHTHGSGVCSPAANVSVHTAEAEYGAPRIQRIFDFDDPAAAHLFRPRR